MKNAPNSRTNLDKAILRLAGNALRANEFRSLIATTIVAQMISDGVIKGGSGLRFRYGEKKTRTTIDLDTAWRKDLDSFLNGLKSRLAEGLCGFTGELRILRQASPRGLPFEYVMQPCEVKLNYLSKPWLTVRLEVGHNELGDADEFDSVPVPADIAELFTSLSLPIPTAIPVMHLEYQVAQKLHGVSAPESKRAHDLIDLQLIMASGEVDLRWISEICKRLFAYRRCQPWPTTIVKGGDWEVAYNTRKGDLDVLPSVDDAVAWANDLIRKLVEIQN